MSAARRNPQEAIGKALTRRTGSAYKAGVSDKRANILKVLFLHGRYASRCDGYKCESGSAISGEALGFPEQGKTVVIRNMNRKESAEVIVAQRHGRRTEPIAKGQTLCRTNRRRSSKSG